MMQQPMYPAVANSPTTETSVAINDTATSIAVLDASKLPAGPNIATIGVDESAETVQYAGKSGNTLTGVVRGFNGTTAKTWPVGTRIARNYTAYDADAARKNIESLASDTATDLPPVPITLSPGLQRIDSDRQARLAHVGFNGRTLVNLLGREGNFEIDSNGDGVADGWLRNPAIGTVFALASSGTLYGKSAQRITSAIEDTTGDRRISKYTIPLSAGKYIVIAECTVDGVNGKGSIAVYGNHTTPATQIASSTNDKSPGIKFARFELLTDGSVGLHLYNQAALGTVGVVQWDGARLYALSSADYAAVESMTPEQIAAKWPYTEGISNVDNVFIKRNGRNLLKGVPDTVSSSAKLNAPYDLTLPSGGGATTLQATIRLPVLGNTAYRFTVNAGEDANRRIWIQQYDVSGVKTTVDLAIAIGTFINFTTQPNTVLLAAIFGSVNTGGPYRFRDWQLVLGSEDMPFAPNDDQSLYAYNANAASSVDGSVADQVYTDVDGRLRIRRWWGRLELSGKLPWYWYQDNTGNKVIVCSAANVASGFSGGARIVKRNDGRPFRQSATTTDAESDIVSISTNNLVLTLNNLDTGWGPDFHPNVAETQAFFYGYRMNNGTFGQPYNGSGSKTWTRWDATSNAGALTTVPTTQAAGYTPYQLQYQLATPVDEPISQEGAITLLAGGNQVEVGSGVIVREQVSTHLFNGLYYINAISSKLRFRVSQILAIYKNGVFDREWTFQTRISSDTAIPTHGPCFANIPVADYDPSAVYTVTYMALDTYLTGIAPLAITGHRAANTRGAIDGAVTDVVALTGRLDVLDSGVQAAYDRGSVGVSAAAAAQARADAAYDRGSAGVTAAAAAQAKADSAYDRGSAGVSAAAAAQAKADAALPAASYTAADVLTKVKTVDGAGSGLDADTLDGYHANPFVPASGLWIPVVNGTGGTLEIGRYIDFHLAGSTTDFDARLFIDTNGDLYHSSSSGIFGLRNSGGVLQADLGGGWVPLGGVKSIQRGETSSAPDYNITEVNVPIAAVNMAKSVVIVTSGYMLTDYNVDKSGTVYAQLTSGTNLLVKRTSTSIYGTVAWQVVEYY